MTGQTPPAPDQTSTITDPAPPDGQLHGFLGTNAWLVDEMYEQFLQDPESVTPTWRAFFVGYRPTPPQRGELGLAEAAAVTPTEPITIDEDHQAEPGGPGGNGSATATATATTTATATPSTSEKVVAVSAATTPKRPTQNERILRGVPARIAQNMELSLAVPTATSFREVPARLLEVNRRIINGYLSRTRGGKVSFTHIIGYAVVESIVRGVPNMNNSFRHDDDGNPVLVTNEHVGLGLAIDMEKPDGSRSLVVPVIRDADTLDFRDFVAAYDALVRKAKTNKLAIEDFAGATVSLTNPGTIGTKQSVPRLMPGQGLIVGVGNLAYPAAYAGADPHMIAEQGISKVLSLTSTYDHRIIQGAESGLFLQRLEGLLLGEHDFYEEIFEAIGVPYVPVKWRIDANPVDRDASMVEKQMQVATLINMHRVRGHLIADLDPLAAQPPEMHAELDPATYGLTIWDLDREFLTGGQAGIYAPVGGQERLPLGEILHVLRDAYCRTVGIEYMHIQEPEEKRWIQEHVERSPDKLTKEEQIHILDRLNKAEALEQFLAKKYVGQKRFGLEGAESAIPVLDAILSRAADEGLDSAVLGMAHRGRLNVLVNIVGKSYEQLFAEFEGFVAPDAVQGSGDVKYHLGQEGVFVSPSDNEISVQLAANPSHLEAVNPVVEGLARARMDQIPESDNPYPVLPILLHGDAAFAGQGVVAETLNLSMIKGYRVGGTIHLIVNNQLGFTTPPASARSSEYCTDVAKMVQAPIFHVNGDDPEACVRVARLAFAYRRQFHKDVVIDMVCYRRHGHNEGDDPSYTQPLMYRRIDQRRSVRKLYLDALVRRGDFELELAELAMANFESELQASLEETRESARETVEVAPHPRPVGVLEHVVTGVDRSVLHRVEAALGEVPDDFTIHPKLARQFAARHEAYVQGQVDWATGEALAFGTLLSEGTSVRLAGQDSRRGTFSQRHSTLFDYQTGEEFVPLSTLATGPTRLWIYDSLLSEYAALGFEYGYSLGNSSALVLWEAQFGDFSNGAQIIIDQFLVAAENKWKQHCGLVLLLPHGSEGQGPEHSSARIERFMNLCAEDNIQVTNPTSAAQYFHLLRRQVHQYHNGSPHKPRPLVVFTPKSGLRAPSYRSDLSEFTRGSFEELVVEDDTVDPNSVTRLVLASGKVGHEAIATRDALGVAMKVGRVEQLFPWPYEAILAETARYPNLAEIVWLQEEPENMGAWNGIKGRLYESFEGRFEIRRVSRDDSGSPATGSSRIHKLEQEQILREAFAPLGPKRRSEFV